MAMTPANRVRTLFAASGKLTLTASRSAFPSATTETGPRARAENRWTHSVPVAAASSKQAGGSSVAMGTSLPCPPSHDLDHASPQDEERRARMSLLDDVFAVAVLALVDDAGETAELPPAQVFEEGDLFEELHQAALSPRRRRLRRRSEERSCGHRGYVQRVRGPGPREQESPDAGEIELRLHRLATRIIAPRSAAPATRRCSASRSEGQPACQPAAPSGRHESDIGAAAASRIRNGNSCFRGGTGCAARLCARNAWHVRCDPDPPGDGREGERDAAQEPGNCQRGGSGDPRQPG